MGKGKAWRQSFDLRRLGRLPSSLIFRFAKPTHIPAGSMVRVSVSVCATGIGPGREVAAFELRGRVRGPLAHIVKVDPEELREGRFLLIDVVHVGGGCHVAMGIDAIAEEPPGQGAAGAASVHAAASVGDAP